MSPFLWLPTGLGMVLHAESSRKNFLEFVLEQFSDNGKGEHISVSTALDPSQKRTLLRDPHGFWMPDPDHRDIIFAWLQSS